MNRLVIVGAGGFGRELRSAVEASPRFRERHQVSSVVFVDDQPDLSLLDAPVVSTIRDYVPAPGDVGLCAIGSCATRRKIAVDLEGRGLRFITFVDDRARVGKSVHLTDGAVICANSIVTVDVKIGRHTHINSGCLVGHDVVIGDFVTLSSAVNLAGNVHVDDDVFFGTGAIVIPGRKIGPGATVGAGSVVVRHVKPRVTVFGNPAKAL